MHSNVPGSIRLYSFTTGSVATIDDLTDETVDKRPKTADSAEERIANTTGQRNSIEITEKIVISTNEKTTLKSIMKKTDSTGTPMNLSLDKSMPPMEIIVTQPSSGGSGTSSDSRLGLNIARSNKIYPS